MYVVSKETRSRMMSGIRGKDTAPEMLVRSVAHSLGLRFRLHVRTLPGRPDLVFPRHRTVIFVHGCFWHRHNCRLAAMPKTRPDFWRAKFDANQRRDIRNRELLEQQGWRVVEVWECETRDPAIVKLRLAQWFGIG
jgi:DNA mismatch endonuclease (patch repair protein)